MVETIKAGCEKAYQDYLGLLNEDEQGEEIDSEKLGLARELARSVLPVAFYTQWYWKTDLHNLLRFLELRADPHAQWEIRQYALQIMEIVRRWVPHTYEAFSDYRIGRLDLSAGAQSVVRNWLAGRSVEQQESGLSPREWKALLAQMGRLEPEV